MNWRSVASAYLLQQEFDHGRSCHARCAVQRSVADEVGCIHAGTSLQQCLSGAYVALPSSNKKR